MYSLLKFASDVQTLVSGARNAVSEWDSGIFTRPSGLDLSVCLLLSGEREETQVLPRDLRWDRVKQDTTIAHRHPDNTSANLPRQTNLPTIRTHTPRQLRLIFRNFPKQKKGEKIFFKLI